MDIPASHIRPPGEASQISAATLSATVPQKTARNSALTDLWRISRCASKAPGQPPTRAHRCNVDSGVRQAPWAAADLSQAYRAKLTRLAAP